MLAQEEAQLLIVAGAASEFAVAAHEEFVETATAAAVQSSAASFRSRALAAPFASVSTASVCAARVLNDLHRTT